MSLQLEATPL